MNCHHCKDEGWVRVMDPWGDTAPDLCDCIDWNEVAADNALPKPNKPSLAAQLEYEQNFYNMLLGE